MDSVVSNYWNEAEFNGFKIRTSFKPCLYEEFPYNDYKTVHKVKLKSMLVILLDRYF